MSPPTREDVAEDDDSPSPSTYDRRFESWWAALKQAGFSEPAVYQLRAEQQTPSYQDEELLSILRSKASELGKTPTYDEWREQDDVPAITTYRSRFGTWNDALVEAGLQPNREHEQPNEYTEAELLDHIRHLSEELGREPSAQDLITAEGPSLRPYKERFQSWERAKELALKRREGAGEINDE